MIQQEVEVHYMRKLGNRNNTITDKWCNERWIRQDEVNDVDVKSESADEYMLTNHGDDCEPVQQRTCTQFKYAPEYCSSNGRFKGDNSVACLYLTGNYPGRQECLLNDAATSPKYEFKLVHKYTCLATRSTILDAYVANVCLKILSLAK